MAFSNRHKALIFELFGIPRTGDSDIFLGFVHRPATLPDVSDDMFTTGDHSDFVTKINSRVTAIEALSDNGTENRIKELLERYDEIETSLIDMQKGGGSEGRTIADDQREVALIRKRVGDNMGLWSIGGSFTDQVDAAWSWDGGGKGDR